MISKALRRCGRLARSAVRAAFRNQGANDEIEDKDNECARYHE